MSRAGHLRLLLLGLLKFRLGPGDDDCDHVTSTMNNMWHVTCVEFGGHLTVSAHGLSSCAVTGNSCLAHNAP